MPARTNTPIARRHALPWIFGLFGVVTVVLLWWSVENTTTRQILNDNRLTTEQVALRLESWIDSRAAAVRLFAGQHAVRMRSGVAFEMVAQKLLDLYPGFQALNFVDVDGVIRSVVPLESNRPALGRNLLQHPDPGVVEAYQRAVVTRELVAGPVVNLYQGGRGVTTYVAVRGTDDATIGYINGVFRVKTLVETCLAEENLLADYRFRLLDPKNAVAYTHGDDDDSEWLHQVAMPVRFVDQIWVLEMAPSQAYVQRRTTDFDELLALFGVLLVVVLSVMLMARFRSLEKLAVSRDRYRQLVESIGDLIVRVDARGRFLYASPSYCEFFGRSEEELIGTEFMPMVHEDDRAATAQAMAQLTQPPYICYVEQRARTRDGWRWMSWSDTAVIDDEGQIVEIIGVGRDIQERKELEQQLRQSQKLQAVGQLAGGVAHDFNNILQAILGNLQFVRDDLGPDHPSLPDLTLVQQSAERASQLTRQLLAFSRQQVLAPVNLDLNELVANHLILLRRLLGESVALEFEPGQDVGPVHADPGQIEQVLMNLCVNARDAVEREGRISITTAARTLTAEDLGDEPAPPGPYVSVAVTDNGHGMDEATVARIFDPFYTTKADGRGTGLGLATVYGIVRQHDGLIKVDSRVGGGTTVSVFLPLAEGALHRVRVEEPPLPARGDETVLLAEDDDAVRASSRRALERAGYRVLVAVDGVEAVELAEAHRADLALAVIDVVMPRLNGPEAARRIREIHPGLPVIFASGYAPGDISISDDDDAQFIAKPYRLQALLQKVRERLDHP